MGSFLALFALFCQTLPAGCKCVNNWLQWKGTHPEWCDDSSSSHTRKWLRWQSSSAFQHHRAVMALLWGGTVVIWLSIIEWRQKFKCILCAFWAKIFYYLSFSRFECCYITVVTWEMRVSGGWIDPALAGKQRFFGRRLVSMLLRQKFEYVVIHKKGKKEGAPKNWNCEKRRTKKILYNERAQKCIVLDSGMG